jgi:hypothetical protein
MFMLPFCCAGGCGFMSFADEQRPFLKISAVRIELSRKKTGIIF